MHDVKQEMLNELEPVAKEIINNREATDKQRRHMLREKLLQDEPQQIYMNDNKDSMPMSTATFLKLYALAMLLTVLATLWLMWFTGRI